MSVPYKAPRVSRALVTVIESGAWLITDETGPSWCLYDDWSHLEEGVWLVEIEDDGRGIPADRMRGVFDPSFSLKESRIGLGLGLPLSFNIMRRHGGDLKLSSEPGKGTVVTIVLPLSAKEGS